MDKTKLFYINHKGLVDGIKGVISFATLTIGFLVVMGIAGGTYPY